MNHNNLKGIAIVKRKDVFITTQIGGLQTIERITYIVSIIFQNLSPRSILKADVFDVLQTVNTR